MASLADPYLKTARAKEHLDDLRERLRVFRESQPIRITREDDVEKQRHIVRLNVQDIPEKFALIVGDFLFCLRSSLDQLVWALAHITTPYPRGTQFPVFEAPNPDLFAQYTTGVPAEALKIIESLQPYLGQNTAAAKSHLLWRLNMLCNIDKHRRIPTDKNITDMRFSDFPKEFIPLIEYDNDTGVISVPIGLKSKMGDPTAFLNVIFGDSHEGIECDFAGMEAIYNFVANSVIPRFTRFFK